MILSWQLLLEMITNGIFIGAMYTLMALGFALIWGILELFNFSHGALYMVGAYLTWFLGSRVGLGFPAALALTFAFMFGFGMLLEFLLVRPLGKYRGSEEWMMGTVVATLGVAIFLEAGALVVFGGQFVSLPPLTERVFEIGWYRISGQTLISFITAIILIGLLWLFLKRTKIGLAMQAMSQDHEGAQMVGINPKMVYPLTFGISAAFAGVAGALLAPMYSIYPSVGWHAFMKAFIVVMIGGLGSVPGTIAAGFLLGISESFSDIFISTHWTTVISFAVMISVLLIRPRGLFGIREQ